MPEYFCRICQKLIPTGGRRGYRLYCSTDCKRLGRRAMDPAYLYRPSSVPVTEENKQLIMTFLTYHKFYARRPEDSVPELLLATRSDITWRIWMGEASTDQESEAIDTVCYVKYNHLYIDPFCHKAHVRTRTDYALRPCYHLKCPKCSMTHALRTILNYRTPTRVLVQPAKYNKWRATKSMWELALDVTQPQLDIVPNDEYDY